ncbi:GNAT family N-acetyltransferase [Streptomyces botrytidirepellens]|uniref:N-acetyltransferase n=1 Tax=Streptomyces botrytidirepellens TaxID=2486417 RepID=A0A3M8WV36_9ACTN|nr:GNAT family protein [Streptomyces botrytidirepellens]RNG34048.1 N-acetyltransferase [Streptomyces botrytidirepellens]
MPEHAYLAEGTRAAIRPHRREDGAEFVRLARQSVSFHRPWLTLPTTDEAYEGFIAQLEREDRRGFLVCVRETGALAGFININNIVRGAFQCGAIGYGAFPPAAGRGYMSEGLGLVLRQAFGPLGLHRIEVNIQPGNEASTALVKRHGFRLEGFSPDFLYIEGAWRDHDRWAMTSDMLGPA